MDETSLKALGRKALQKLAKANGVKANLKSSEIIKQLIAKQPSKLSLPRPTASTSQVPRDSTAHSHRRVSAISRPRDEEGDPEPVQDAPRTQAPSSQPPVLTQRPVLSASKSRQPQKGKSRSAQPPGFEAGSERTHSAPPEPLAAQKPSTLSWVSRRQVSPSQQSSPSPLPVASQRKPLPSFEQHLSTLSQPRTGPSRTQPKAATLGVFNKSSASRAPWPQKTRNPPRRAPSPSSPSPPAGSPPPISNFPTFPPGTHPYSISTGVPKGLLIASYHRPPSQGTVNGTAAGTSASASASAPRRGQIIPEPGYRTRSPTPLEEYDSLRGVPLFPEPASDYEESWTPYSPPEAPQASNSHLRADGVASAHQPAARTPTFPLTRAVFGPPPRVFSPPSRSPVFRPPSLPPRPTSPIGRDEASPDLVPQRIPFGVLAEQADESAVLDALGKGEGSNDAGEEEEEEEEEADPGMAPATDEQLHRMVARLATLARHHRASQTAFDELTEEVERLNDAAPRIRQQLRQERGGFERMRAFLAHVNVRLEPEWDHDGIWDEARLLRDDGGGNQLEVETSDEEEAEWRRENPRQSNARTTEIEMRKWTRYLPGVCEDEDWDNLRDIAEATERCRTEYREIDAIRARTRARGAGSSHRGEEPIPQNPKRRRDDDNGGRAKKKVRGSAGRTPPPQAFFRKGKNGGRVDGEQRIKTPPLVGIAEEDSEEDMEMTSVV